MSIRSSHIVNDIQDCFYELLSQLAKDTAPWIDWDILRVFPQQTRANRVLFFPECLRFRADNRHVVLGRRVRCGFLPNASMSRKARDEACRDGGKHEPKPLLKMVAGHSHVDRNVHSRGVQTPR